MSSRSGGRAAFVLLIAYVCARAALGAAVNPPLNGPDEAGHVEYVRTLVDTAGTAVTGVEARQPRLYYALAALPWRATAGSDPPFRLFAVRLLSAVAGAGTAIAAWLVARQVWPSRPRLAFAAGAVATLAPGYLFLLASVTNDPLAAAFSSLAIAAAVRLTLRRDADAAAPPRRWPWSPWGRWLAWGIATGLALATKLTTVPVALATAATLAFTYRRPLLAIRGARPLIAVAGFAAVAAYAVALAQHPTSSPLAALARFGPVALVRAPLAFLRLDGGIGEAFRTHWYAYDYAVSWPLAAELVLRGSAAAVCGLALLGLVTGRGARGMPLRVLWVVAAAQVVFVAGRLSLSTVLANEMGGAAQAKAFFPAIVPFSVLLVAGLAAILARSGVRDDRWLALGLWGWLILMDGASLAPTLWHHYRWWQVGL